MPDFHILFGEPTIHKKILARRWTIGNARDQAITHMMSHLSDSFPDAVMPHAKDVKIFREQFETSQPNTLIQNLHPTENSDFLAFVPGNTSTGFGAILTKLRDDLENLKKDSEATNDDLEATRRELADLRAQQTETLSWMVVGDEGVLDCIMLRNLLDRAQMAVGKACGLTTSQNPSSMSWRSQFIGIELDDCLAKATSLLQDSSGLDRSVVRWLCASQHALQILVEKSEIRRDGDKFVHEGLINRQQYTVAIERQCQLDPGKCEALKLLLELAKAK